MRFLIKNEVLKNRFEMWCFLAVIVVSGVAFIVKNLIGQMVADYVEISLDVYLYMTMVRVMIYFVLPLFLILMNVYFDYIESKSGGWCLIKANKGSCSYNLAIKLLLNYFICLIMFLLMIISGSFYMKARGMEVVIEAAVIPLFMSFLCFVLNCTVLFLICLLFDSIIAKMMYSVLEMILVIVVSQTEYATCIPFTYASSIALDYQNCILKIGICVIFSILIGYLNIYILNKFKD